MLNASNKYLQFMVGTVAFLFTFLPGLDWAFKKYDVPDSYFNGVLALLFFAYIAGAAFVVYRNRGQKKSQKSSEKSKSKRFAVGYIALTGVLLVLFLYYFSKEKSSDLLLTESLPRIAAAIDDGHNMQAFLEIKSLLQVHPENQILKHYLEKSTRFIEVTSVPSDVAVHVKYGSDSTWVHLGATPLDSIAVPLLDKNPFQLRFEMGDNAYLVPPGNSGKFDLTGMEEVPAGHAFIPGLDARIMWFPGIDLGRISYGPFAISKTEVSNTEYQAFVNHDDYKNSKYWDFPVTINGTEHTFEQALRTFSGKFGKPGPANWSYGSFPVDQGDFPVTGISWFEARAYARFRNMQLPNVYQWLVAARLSHSGILPDIRDSNLKSAYLREVDDPRDMNFHGLMNIAGNVKEWATNPHGDGFDRLSILGGAYYDNSYNFNDYYSASPLDRSIGNGMRLVKSVGRETPESLDDIPVTHVQRDILSESDVSDEVFEVYRTQFDYAPYPLDVDIEMVPGHPADYVVERFEMLPPYENDEPLHGYIIYRKEPKRKLKPVIIFPGAGSIYTDTDANIVPQHIERADYLLREGYAIVHPVYFSTYNRRKTLTTWWANESEQYRDSIVKIGKDFRRTIDYLEQRKDIDARNLTYQGFSWGSLMSNTLLAIDPRVRSAFVCVGGLQLPRAQRAIDPALFIRRVRTPIMHITGKLDGIFEYESSQIPMQKLLGTPKKDQKMIVLEDVGHGIPRDTIIVNHLAWLKKYELR